jgi:hypothetical protein
LTLWPPAVDAVAGCPAWQWAAWAGRLGVHRKSPFAEFSLAIRANARAELEPPLVVQLFIVGCVRRADGPRLPYFVEWVRTAAICDARRRPESLLGWRGRLLQLSKTVGLPLGRFSCSDSLSVFGPWFMAYLTFWRGPGSRRRCVRCMHPFAQATAMAPRWVQLGSCLSFLASRSTPLRWRRPHTCDTRSLVLLLDPIQEKLGGLCHKVF